MIVSFLNFFMKSYGVGTHYNHIADKILIYATTATAFMEK